MRGVAASGKRCWMMRYNRVLEPLFPTVQVLSRLQDYFLKDLGPTMKGRLQEQGSLFMRGNRVVRAVEVTGDLGNAMRHVAAQPEVRAVEEAINRVNEYEVTYTVAFSVTSQGKGMTKP